MGLDHRSTLTTSRVDHPQDEYSGDSHEMSSRPVGREDGSGPNEHEYIPGELLDEPWLRQWPLMCMWLVAANENSRNISNPLQTASGRWLPTYDRPS